MLPLFSTLVSSTRLEKGNVKGGLRRGAFERERRYLELVQGVRSSSRKGMGKWEFFKKFKRELRGVCSAFLGETRSFSCSRARNENAGQFC